MIEYYSSNIKNTKDGVLYYPISDFLTIKSPELGSKVDYALGQGPIYLFIIIHHQTERQFLSYLLLLGIGINILTDFKKVKGSRFDCVSLRQLRIHCDDSVLFGRSNFRIGSF